MSIGYRNDKSGMPDREQLTLDQLKDGFLNWVVNGAKEKLVLIGQHDAVWTIDALMRGLADCKERLPSWAAVELGMPIDSTYADAILKCGRLSVK